MWNGKSLYSRECGKEFAEKQHKIIFLCWLLKIVYANTLRDVWPACVSMGKFAKYLFFVHEKQGIRSEMRASPDPIRWIIVQRMLFKYCDFQLKHWRGKMFYFLPIKAENSCYFIKIKNLSNFRYFIKQICEEIRYFSCDEILSVKLKHFEKSSNPDVIETVE